MGSTTARRLGGRFALERLLKCGNSVETHLGTDTTTGRQVVVKTVRVPDVSTAMRFRLEHEAVVLQRLSSAAAPALLASGYDGDVFYLVQPHFDGRTLRERLDGGPLDVDSALRIGIDVLATLQVAHDEGVLHRDVKPANVVTITGEPGDGGDAAIERAVLIDFGLARSGALDPSVRDELVGTVRYLAPEAAGLLELPVDERSDLYAVGVLLFECLAGRPPFVGDAVGDVLRQHLTAPAPQLRSLGLAVPRAIDGVIQRLLRKEPSQRYQSALAVREDLEEIAAELDRGVAEPVVTPGLRDRREVLTEPAFVGRKAELEALTDLVEQTHDGGSALVLVEAESGGGKSRVLDEVAAHAARHDFWVLRGQGIDQAGQRPFQVLDGLVASVVTRADSDAGFAPRLQAALGDRAEAVAAALPGLAPCLGVDPNGEVGPEAYAENRSVDALTSLLQALGVAGGPVLIVLDDCQWADGLSISLLGKWHQQAIHDERGTLVVAAFRSEEVSAGHPLRALNVTTTVALGPFDRDDIAALCESMAGPLPEAAVDTIARLSEGSPFMASAVVRGMVESGALRHTAVGWEIDPGPMEDVHMSRRAALFLLRRFDLLSPDAERLLTAGAVLGKEFDLDLAVELTGQSGPAVTLALDDARRRHILWIDEATNRCAFAHDKLREALLGRLGADARRELHRQAAEQIEALSTDRVFELAYHFDAAGEAERALSYAWEAGERARSQHSLDVAATYYRIAADAAAATGAADDRQARIAEGLGDVLVLQGRYDEATELLQRAHSLTTERTARAVIEGKLGDVAFKRGAPADARRYLEGALRDLGRWVPRSGFAFAVAAIVQVFIQVLHTLLPRLFLERRHTDGHEHEFMAIRMYSRLAYVYWFHAGKMPCGWAHLTEMNLAERYPPTAELAQAYSEHAPVATMIPWFTRGIKYTRRSYEIRRDLGDVWGQGQSLSFFGVVLYAASRYEECIETCREAVRLLERTGDRWEQHTATWHLAFCHHRLGELDKATELAREVYASATAIGDQASAGISLGGWARASRGRVPADVLAAELERQNEDAHTATEVRVADAMRSLRQHDLKGALSRLEEAAAIVKRAGLRQEYVLTVQPWTATVLRMLVEDVSGLDPARRRALLRRAAKAARKASRTSRLYRNHRPHALREAGLVAALHGHSRRASRLLARSLEEAKAQGAEYEVAQTVVAQARIAAAANRPGAADELAVAEAALAAIEGVDETELQGRGRIESSSLALVDRFATLLEVGRRIASAPSPAAVYGAVREAALTLLRGEHCHVINVDEQLGEGATTESGEQIDALSRGLLSQAIERGTPVASDDAAVDDSSESLVLSGIRSVLCAPIWCEDRIVSCFYVTHRQVGGLFGPAEIQLAEFVATLAGASLEHVAGSEARFRSLAQNSSDVITIVGADGVVTYHSSSLERVFGYEPQELTGTRLDEWLHPDHSAEMLGFLRAAVEEGKESAVFETRMRHRDGSWRHAETAVTSMLNDPSVRGVVLNTRDISDRVALENELRMRAWHDSLTGLANRSLFTERVGHALALGARERRQLAVLFLDLDDFKSINDTMGHACGDLLLAGVADRLETCVRPGDTVARFGGDEFAILLEDTGLSGAEEVASRIISALAEPFVIDEEERLARASVGVVVGYGLETSDELLSAADAAMYVAKARGKSRYEVFETSMREAALARSSVRTDLEWALLRGELRLHYQPIIDVAKGVPFGFEALIRWEHPTRGLLAPVEFIDLAEETGLIVSIGAWVLRTACHQAQAWRNQFGCQLSMAVNVSARQLQDPGLVGEIGTALRESGLDPSALVLEITESATVQDTESVITRLEELKSLGVLLAIDDFGTGYSSLSYLRRFPVDHLKVDRSFVSGIATNDEDAAIVSSVTNLGHALGIKVVAEGIETADQLAKVASVGCDLAQGYHWARPQAPAEVAAWLEQTLVLAAR